jgi:hypothetical protein
MPSAPPRAPIDLAAALETVLVKSVESQADLAVKIGNMIAGQMEAMTSVYARRLGARGGKKSAEHAKRNSNGTFKPRKGGCRLCANPAVLDPQADEIKNHMQHVQGYYEDPRGGIHVSEKDFETTPGGDKVIECEECGDPDAKPKMSTLH